MKNNSHRKSYNSQLIFALYVTVFIFSEYENMSVAISPFLTARQKQMENVAHKAFSKNELDCYLMLEKS